MVAVAAVVVVVVVFVVVGVDGIECSYLIAVIVAQAIYSTGRTQLLVVTGHSPLSRCIIN